MAVAERFRMRTPAGRDDGQDGLPRGFVTVGIWGLLFANGLFVSVLLGRTLRQSGATGGRHTGCEAACSDRGSVSDATLGTEARCFSAEICCFPGIVCHLAGLTVCLT
jgi:hypothetical protein